MTRGAVYPVDPTGALVGVERADDTHKQARFVHVEAVLASLPIEDYTLMIAGTAAATNRILLTTDGKAEFGQFAGVRSEVIRIP